MWRRVYDVGILLLRAYKKEGIVFKGLTGGWRDASSSGRPAGGLDASTSDLEGESPSAEGLIVAVSAVAVLMEEKSVKRESIILTAGVRVCFF